MNSTKMWPYARTICKCCREQSLRKEDDAFSEASSLHVHSLFILSYTIADRWFLHVRSNYPALPSISLMVRLMFLDRWESYEPGAHISTYALMTQSYYIIRRGSPEGLCELVQHGLVATSARAYRGLYCHIVPRECCIPACLHFKMPRFQERRQFRTGTFHRYTSRKCMTFLMIQATRTWRAMGWWCRSPAIELIGHYTSPWLRK